MIPGQFCDPIDQFGDPGSEAGIDIIQGYPGNVFDNIVQERGGQQLGISGVHLSDEDFCYGAGWLMYYGPDFLFRPECNSEAKSRASKKIALSGFAGSRLFDIRTRN